MLLIKLWAPLVIYAAVTAVIQGLIPGGTLFQTAVSAGVTLPLLLILFRDDWALSLKRRVNLLYPVILGIGASVFVNNIIAMSGIKDLFSSYREVSKILYSPSIWLQVAAIGLLIPAVEEMIFRVLCFGALRTRLSFLPAAVLSSVYFAVYHGNVPQALYAFILGGIMCYLYERCRTVAAPYLFHMAANLLSLMCTYLQVTYRIEVDRAMMAAAAILSSGLMFLGFLLVRRNTKFEEEAS